jgi:hypothetical protein
MALGELFQVLPLGRYSHSPQRPPPVAFFPASRPPAVECPVRVLYPGYRRKLAVPNLKLIQAFSRSRQRREPDHLIIIFVRLDDKSCSASIKCSRATPTLPRSPAADDEHRVTQPA